MADNTPQQIADSISASAKQAAGGGSQPTVVQGTPLDTAAEKAAQETAKKAAEDRARREEEEGRKIAAHQEQVTSNHPGVKALEGKPQGPSAQETVARRAALIEDAIVAKHDAGLMNEAQRLAMGEAGLLSKNLESTWDKGHYGEYNKAVLAERNAVVVTKEGDTMAPSLADAAGASTPAPGLTPGSARKNG